MADFFVQNLTHPVPSVHPAGVHIEIGINSDASARDAFVALYPAAAGDEIYVVQCNAFAYFHVVSTLSYPSEPAPALPPSGS